MRTRKISIENAFMIIEEATQRIVDTRSPRPRNKSSFDRANKLLRDRLKDRWMDKTNREHGLYIEFLLDVEEQCGLSMRISAGFLGQASVARYMSKAERQGLVSLLESKKDQEPFNSPIDAYFPMQEMTQARAENNSPSRSDPTALGTAHNQRLIKRSVPHSRSGLIANDLIPAIRRDPTKFDHASVEGIQNVFKEEIYNAIRRVRVRGEVSEKASVSMSIPGHTEMEENVPCSMTLDIYRLMANGIIMGLFGITIAKADASLLDPTHIILKGANVDRIEAMFGLEIQNAISQCPVRKEEIAHEQEHTTDCVSMSLEGETAWVHLSLGLAQAVDIIPKLQFRTRDTNEQ
jgi:hypothetical protein